MTLGLYLASKLFGKKISYFVSYFFIKICSVIKCYFLFIKIQSRKFLLVLVRNKKNCIFRKILFIIIVSLEFIHFCHLQKKKLNSYKFILF